MRCPSSALSLVIVSPCFFFSVPDMAPRTLWACQPIVAPIWVTVFAAGTGNPYFSTDTAATLRAMEIKADAILKATKVEGIYDRDPVRHPGAQMFGRLSYDRFLNERIGVMDSTAVTLATAKRSAASRSR